MKARPNSNRAGFSLVVLVFSLSILTFLGGVVSMRASGMTNKARAAKIISMVESLRTPVVLYREDTGAWPIEYSNRTGANVHRLAFDPGVTGWEGPYIEDPIRRSMNPTGGTVNLYNQIPNGFTNSNGIDIDGDGTSDYAGTQGSIILFTGIDEEIAVKVDAAFDEGLAGTWSDAGRVEYNTARRQLAVLVASN